MSRSKSSTKLVEKEIGKYLGANNVRVYEAILRQWKAYVEGRVSKHDVFCEVASLLAVNYQDLLLQLRRRLVDADTGSPTPA